MLYFLQREATGGKVRAWVGNVRRAEARDLVTGDGITRVWEANHPMVVIIATASVTWQCRVCQKCTSTYTGC